MLLGRGPARTALFVLTAPAATEFYTLSLHDALPILPRARRAAGNTGIRSQSDCYHGDRPASGTLWIAITDRKSTRLNSSHQIISYAVFCLKKKKTTQRNIPPQPWIQYNHTYLTVRHR